MGAHTSHAFGNLKSVLTSKVRRLLIYHRWLERNKLSFCFLRLHLDFSKDIQLAKGINFKSLCAYKISRIYLKAIPSIPMITNFYYANFSVSQLVQASLFCLNSNSCRTSSYFVPLPETPYPLL